MAAVPSTRRVRAATGSNALVIRCRRSVSSASWRSRRASRSAVEIFRVRSTTLMSRSGDTVSPSRSAWMIRNRPSAVGAHEYSGLIVRIVLFENSRVRDPVARS